MKKVRSVTVSYNGKEVGKLALFERNLCAFEYSKEWLLNGFSISPLSLPLESKVYIPKLDPLGGIHGVFADSLPDGWGQLLLARMLARNKVDLTELTGIQRLSIVGTSGMGALEYRPANSESSEAHSDNLDEIAEQCKKLLANKDISMLDELYALGASSGGARPKILTEFKGEDWIIKFASSLDSDDIGREEYEYSMCAAKCNIVMAETRLFPSVNCQGYFGTKRFDRRAGRKVHMISVAGLLETSHRYPNLDYNDLMKLTLMVTNDYGQIEQLYRRMCFNVFAHNRDDHSKNFSYLYDEDLAAYVLSPAYDLTYSNSIGGEHATTVNGNCQNPSERDLLAVAGNIGMDIKVAKVITEEIKEKVVEELGKYLN